MFDVIKRMSLKPTPGACFTNDYALVIKIRLKVRFYSISPRSIFRHNIQLGTSKRKHGIFLWIMLLGQRQNTRYNFFWQCSRKSKCIPDVENQVEIFRRLYGVANFMTPGKHKAFKLRIISKFRYYQSTCDLHMYQLYTFRWITPRNLNRFHMVCGYWILQYLKCNIWIHHFWTILMLQKLLIEKSSVVNTNRYWA